MVIKEFQEQMHKVIHRHESAVQDQTCVPNVVAGARTHRSATDRGGKEKKEREPVDGAGGQGGWGVIHTHKPAGSDSPPKRSSTLARDKWGPHRLTDNRSC